MSEIVDVLLPSDQTEGTQSHVRAWLKSIGDAIAENEPLLEIETDKVTVEVPSPCGGVLAAILAPAETEVAPGAVLGRIERGASVRGSDSHPRPARRTATGAAPFQRLTPARRRAPDRARPPRLREPGRATPAGRARVGSGSDHRQRRGRAHHDR